MRREATDAMRIGVVVRRSMPFCLGETLSFRHRQSDDVVRAIIGIGAPRTLSISIPIWVCSGLAIALRRSTKRCRENLAKSIFTPQYERLRSLLVEARSAAGLTQSELAACLERPQSYVSKYECGERRLDVVEFLEVAKCLKFNGSDALRHIESGNDAKPAMIEPSAEGKSGDKKPKSFKPSKR
jgi:hypothetical protein